jgi:hypothetical protein
MKLKKKILKKTIRKIGLGRINKIIANQGLKYELTKKGANHYYYYWRKAKKKIDLKKMPAFWDLATKIIDEKRTTLYYDRLFTLWQAVENLQSSDLSVVEIGTYKGGSAKFIIETIKQFGYQNKLYIFDTFEGHVILDRELDDGQNIGDFNDTSYEDVKAYINSPEVEIHKGNFIETAKKLTDGKKIGLVHIDVDIYPVTDFALNYFKNRTHQGSFIVIDDYGNPSCLGLKKAVDDFVKVNKDFRMMYLMTGQALLIKV